MSHFPAQYRGYSMLVKEISLKLAKSLPENKATSILKIIKKIQEMQYNTRHSAYY